MIDKLIKDIPLMQQDLIRGSNEYNKIYKKLNQYVQNTYKNNNHTFSFGDFEVKIPMFNMGNCDSSNLFDLDEIILFSFYTHNNHRYKNAVDIGANIGIHSVVMSKCGFNVSSYEPDPIHYNELNQNIIRNNCHNIDSHLKAVSNQNGILKFIRILNNTTGSHIQGSKDNVYGPTETFEVDVIESNQVIDGVDLVKIDAEGHEDVILNNINLNILDNTISYSFSDKPYISFMLMK